MACGIVPSAGPDDYRYIARNFERGETGLNADTLTDMARSLKTLNLKGYRAFRDFRVADFGRVNLIVGKNNAGKK